jgi:hypothetical protein
MLKYIPSTPNFFRAYSMKETLHVIKEFSAFHVLIMWVFPQPAPHLSSSASCLHLSEVDHFSKLSYADMQMSKRYLRGFREFACD